MPTSLEIVKKPSFKYYRLADLYSDNQGDRKYYYLNAIQYFGTKVIIGLAYLFGIKSSIHIGEFRFKNSQLHTYEKEDILEDSSEMESTEGTTSLHTIEAEENDELLRLED